MPSRKRGRQEMEAEEAPQETPLVERLRNMWQFANLGQYLFTFGKAVRIEDLSIEDLETECLKPGPSQKLSDIGLALLKFVSSHRGLTPDMFDEYARRQYESKLPTRNPFGTEEKLEKFADFDVFTKIRVLYQLSQWTMVHGERIRERMPEQKDTEQSYWRIEPTGWDADENTYFVLDDNRLYRCTEPEPPPPPPAKPKKNSKKAKQMARAAKRQRKMSEVAQDNDADEDDSQIPSTEPSAPPDEGFGGKKWECVAITLDEYTRYLNTIRRSKNPNEKILHQQLADNVLPIVEKAEEEQQRKIAKRERELLNLEKMATAKRSSRLAGKLEKQKEDEEAIEAEKKRQAELAAAKKEQERIRKMENERETRIMTREQRVKEREMRRVLHEEELANLSEDSKKLQEGESRASERHIKVEIEKRKRALEELAQESDWMFDCSGCGVYGENLDDGTGIIACEKCSVWQHLACLGLSQEAAEQKDFHFVCSLCKRREEDRQKSAKKPIKLDFRKLGSSASPTSEKTERLGFVNGDGSHPKRRLDDEAYSTSPSPKKAKPSTNGFHLESSSRDAASPAGISGAPALAASSQNAVQYAGSARSAMLTSSTNDDHVLHDTMARNGRTPPSPPSRNGATIAHGLSAANAQSPERSSHPAISKDVSRPTTQPIPPPRDGQGLFFNSFDRQSNTNALGQGAVSPTKPSAGLSTSPTLHEPNKDSSTSPRVGFPQSGGSPNSILAPPPALSSLSPSAPTPSKSSQHASLLSSPSRSGAEAAPPPAHGHTASVPRQDPDRQIPTSPASIFPSPVMSAANRTPAATNGTNPNVISASSTPAMANLPDPRSGISPTKQASSPRARGTVPSTANVDDTIPTIMHDARPVLPPAPSLSPTARPVDLTPPRKALTPEQQQQRLREDHTQI